MYIFCTCVVTLSIFLFTSHAISIIRILFYGGRWWQLRGRVAQRCGSQAALLSAVAALGGPAAPGGPTGGLRPLWPRGGHRLPPAAGPAGPRGGGDPGAAARDPRRADPPRCMPSPALFERPSPETGEKCVLNFLIFDPAGGLRTLKPKGKVRKSLSSLAEGKPVLSYKRRPVLVGNIKSNLRCMEHDVCNIDNYESPPPPCVTYFQQAPSLGTTRWPKGRPVQAYERGQIIQKW